MEFCEYIPPDVSAREQDVYFEVKHPLRRFMNGAIAIVCDPGSKSCM